MKVLVRAVVVTCLVGLVPLVGNGTPSARKTFDFELDPLLQVNQRTSPVPEHLAFQQLLRMVISLAKEADKQAMLGNAKRADYLRRYFDLKAGLSADQSRILKKVAEEVSSPSGCRPANSPESEQNITRSKLKLKSLLGAGGVDLLDRYVSQKLIPRIRYSEVGDTQRPMFGFTSIDYIYNSDEVVGYSYTNESAGFCQVAVNQVTATLTSDELGLLASDSAEVCDEIAEVFLYWESPNPGDRLCMEAEHAYAITWVQMRPNSKDVFGLNPPEPNGGWYCEYHGLYNLPPSDDCWTAPMNGIQGVSFQLIATDSPAIDTNPNVGGGLRIFPDKNSPTDTADRQTIRVAATPSNELPGRPIYFRAFDLDDPETNTVIDTNGTTGNDNKGFVTGGTTAGRLSAASATPNSSGVATVNFTVTIQPGDNFAVAASTDESLLANATIDGINLRTAGGTLIESDCDGTAPICRSEMLTVWRRLHIEVDSMGYTQENFVLGNVANAAQLPRNQWVTLNVNTLNPLDEERFENGRMTLGSTSLKVSVNTGSTVTVKYTGGQAFYSIPANALFALYDDDDFNSNDGTGLLGDFDEDIPSLERTYLEDSDDVELNRFAPAYIVPKYDIGDGNGNTTFFLNVTTPSNAALRDMYDFDQITTEARSDFWTVYLLSAYQPPIQFDEDPESEDGVVGRADGEEIFGIFRGQGAIVFMENNGAKECQAGNSQPEFCNIQATKIHEIAHRFGTNDDAGEGGVMDSLTTYFSPASLAIIRNADYP